MRGDTKAGNSFLYMFKAIACILVIFIHCLFPGPFGKDVQALSRFAVLYFFVISGRFLLKDLPIGTDPAIIRKRMLSKISHLAVITLSLTLLYNVYSLIIAGTVGYGIKDLASQKYNLHELWLLFVFNSGKIIYDYTYDIDHLWYLYAVLYVFVLVFIFSKYAKKWSGFLSLFFTGMLFFAELLQLYYPIRPFDISIRTWYVVRNWLLEGIPFIMDGVWLDSVVNDARKSRAADAVRRVIQSCTFSTSARKNRIILHILAVAGLIMSVVEYRRFGDMTVYAGSVVTLVAVMLLGEVYGQLHNRFAVPFYLYHLGKDLSASVYYFHIMIISIISRLFYIYDGKELLSWLKPLIAVAASVIVAEVICYFKYKLKMGK